MGCAVPQRRGECAGHGSRVVAEHSAAPRAEHKPPVTVGRGHLEDPGRPAEQYSRDTAGVLRLVSQDRHPVGCRQRCADGVGPGPILPSESLVADWACEPGQASQFRPQYPVQAPG
jgi:hypothetical protein